MNHDQWRVVKEKFQEVVSKPEAEQASYLVEICGDDAMLRAEVESLIHAYKELEGFLEPPVIVKIRQGKSGCCPE